MVFFLLPWLLVLLTLGTISQRYLGLYASEKLFFGSAILWIRFIPLPGAYTTLALLALSVLAKLVLKSPWRKHNLGIIISHISVLVLLLGGMISALTREEGYISLLPEQVSDSIADYHDRMLVLLVNGKLAEVLPYDQIASGQKLFASRLPFSLKVTSSCYPCAPVERNISATSAHGMAAKLSLVDALPLPDESRNRAGVTLEVEGAAPEQNGEYIAFETLNQPPEITHGKDVYRLEMRPQARALPFSLQLLRFEQENHPGTKLAREYRSQVLVKDGTLQWKTEISMNEPLRYRGYTIYQSSFIEGDAQTTSVLAVVKNAGWLFPYIAIITLCAGLVVHLVMRKSSVTAKSLCVAALCAAQLFTSHPVSAEESSPLNMQAFGQIPILHEGRMKPLDSFARAVLKGITGNVSQGDTSVNWLAELLFNPQTAMQRPVFLIRSFPLVQSLSLQPNSTKRFSFNELIAALSSQQANIERIALRDPKTLNDSERELLHVSEMVDLYARVAGSLSLLAPMQDVSPELRKELSLSPDEELSYHKLLRVRHALMDKLKLVVAKKQSDVVKYTPLEQEMAKLAFYMDSQQKIQGRNALFRVMPAEWNKDHEWLSLWALTEQGQGSPTSGELFAAWAKAMRAWNIQDNAAWQDATSSIKDRLLAQQEVNPQTISLELLYNHFSPLGKVVWGYALLIVLSLVAIVRPSRKLFNVACMVMLLSLVLHSSGLLARMIILGRPPVSTLYESMIFVSFVAALAGLWLSWNRKNLEGILSGALVALITLSLADVFAGDGDTLEMLTAVLNTNFWLGTHVVCITAGYGFSLITAIMAHIYLIRRVMSPNPESLRSQHRLLHWLALLSLCLTATGTMLGGIWADQSWGRFWGWDPKENGALAIVIWLIWALHGRLSGHLRERGFAVVLAFTSIVVAMAWVGVNLLSVGLHSYGFSNAAAWGLPAFCFVEILTIATLAMLSPWHNHDMQDA